MTLNFPLNPSNGDEYQGYVYDATDNVWNRLPNNPEFVRFSETAPSNPQEGTLWFNTTVGKMFVYYNDGSSSQWVSAIGGSISTAGTEGQMLIHDGTEWVAYDGGSRNLLYNGAMQVAQRGTSSTGITAAGYYTADRWRGYIDPTGGLGTWTNSIESDGPTGSGFTKSWKWLCTTANSSLDAADLFFVGQRLEGQDLQALKKGTADAESLTLSFWVKSNVTGTYTAILRDYDNTRSISASYTIASSGTWEKKTITFAGDTSGAFDNNNAVSMEVQFYLAAGSNLTSGTLQTSWGSDVVANRAVGQTNLSASTSNYWQVTGVQLEAGTVATPFEHKSYATELAECERYYQQLGYWTGLGEGTAYIAASIPFRTRMRTNASISIIPGAILSWRNIGGGDSSSSTWSLVAPGASDVTAWSLFTGGVSVSDNVFYSDRYVNKILQVDAEL